MEHGAAITLIAGVRPRRGADAPQDPHPPAAALDKRHAQPLTIETGFACHRCGGPIVLVHQGQCNITRCMHCEHEVRP